MSSNSNDNAVEVQGNKFLFENVLPSGNAAELAKLKKQAFYAKTRPFFIANQVTATRDFGFENVKRVKRICTEDKYCQIFPKQKINATYTYENFLRAIAYFPMFGFDYKNHFDENM